jgi:phosphoglycolate phosphatase (TIGR01487 family)
MKLLASDFDGTLTNTQGLIAPEVIRAIKALEFRGIKVALISGMNFPSLYKISCYLGCTGAVIAENGGIIKYQDLFRVIGKGNKSKNMMKKLKKYIPSLTESWDNPYRSVDYAFERDAAKDIITNFVQQSSDVQFLDSGVAYHFLDSNVDKKVGLNIAARFMKVNLSDIAVIGDNENDIGLFEDAGLTIAVANAHPKLKRMADYVTRRRNGFGFVEAANLLMSKLDKKVLGIIYPPLSKEIPKNNEIIRIANKYMRKTNFSILEIMENKRRDYTEILDYIMYSDILIAFIQEPKHFISVYPLIRFARWIDKKVVVISKDSFEEKLMNKENIKRYPSLDSFFSETV